MKKTIALLLFTVAGLAGCSTTSTNNANIKNTNTNTGYVTNSETNAKPTVPANATNIEPPSVNSVTGNSNSNSRGNTNTNANTKKP